MDLLTELLKQAGLCQRRLDMRQLPDGVALRFPCERSIGLHVLLDGEAFIHAPGLPAPLSLKAGDIALMARGVVHSVSRLAVLTGAVPVLLIGAPDEAASLESVQDDRPLLSGAYQLWQNPGHPFFSQIPQWTVLRAAEHSADSPLSLTIQLLKSELQRRSLGSEVVLNGLLHAVFTFALRSLIEKGGSACPGWAQAVNDPQIRIVIDRMHQAPAQDWTLEDMARVCGLSRTAFAERFTAAMGEPPATHLRSIRVQKAMQLLSETDLSLERIGELVGYKDAFGFSKVFKRIATVSPSTFRRQERLGRDNPYRFAAE